MMDSISPCQISSFLLHKKAELPEDCQDAYACNSQKGRYAIADGATQSFFSKQWANLLVKRFCEDDERLNNNLFVSQDWQAWLEPIQKEWKNDIKGIVQRLPDHKYHIRNRYIKNESARATFVGLRVNKIDENEISWRAMIIGDSCLFLVREPDEVTSHLIRSAQEFDYYPHSFASVDRDNKYPPSFIEGTAKQGDFFILATDGLAKWILMQHEHGNWSKIFSQLRSITNEEQFKSFIESAREEAQMRLENDDVTLMMIPVRAVIKHKQDQGAPKRWMAIAIVALGLLLLSFSVNVYSFYQWNTATASQLTFSPTTTLLPTEIKPTFSPTTTPLPIEVKPTFSPTTTPLPTEIKPTSSPTTTPLPTEVKPTFSPTTTPLPTFSPRSIQLPAGSQIYSSQSESEMPMFTIEKDTEALLLSEPQSESFVNIQVYILTTPDNHEILSATQSSEMIYELVHEVSVYQVKKPNQWEKVGQLHQGARLEKSYESTSENTTWYQVRINGFMRR